MARKIGVAQLTPPVPNSVAPECICVPKVYDWVVFTEEIRTTIPISTPIPEDCPSIVTEITCSLESKPFFPINCVGDRSCTVLERRSANIDGINGHIVKLQQQIPVSVTFIGTDATGASASCTFPLSVPFIHQVLLCFPEEFTDENLVCRVISGDCTITTPPPMEGAPLPTSIGVELLLCIEIQVLAAVQLEVLARSCAPRSSIPVTASNGCLPLLFPEQCDFFPQPNCPCQGTVEGSCAIDGADCRVNVNGIAASGGEQTLIATICDGCAQVNSSLIYHFSSNDPNVPSFTFIGDSNNFFTGCIGIGNILLAVGLSGMGTVITETTTISNVSFILLLGNAVFNFDKSWQFFLIGPFTAEAFNDSVEVGNLFVRSCVQFP